MYRVCPSVRLPCISQSIFELSGLYYKTITIVIMTIVSLATIWGVTYDRN